MIKIDWSGRSHNFSKNEIKYLSKVISKADPLTGGKEIKLFEKKLSEYLKTKNVYALSSAAAALELISILCNLKKKMKLSYLLTHIVPQLSHLLVMEEK